MLVGNKCDLENERAVSKEDGEQFAEAKWSGLLFVEVSVATTRMLRSNLASSRQEGKLFATQC
ncbi:hypothetical protein SLEP1_g19556 [Rubroshorea leprosula]|uniref:Small monomeric GTPase n=1 Tax=Rubroshorea leprosula TaxID=152421 RepID=A0AAV5J8R5_9ROSI|nr:hypothetical protein SLEP1_g19556 [Rubroshorea leprosula]